MTREEGQRAVWAEALTWQKTPWHHRAHLKGVGVDCAQLLVAAFSGAGIVEWFDTGDYPRDWHLHKDRERMVPIVLRFCDELPEGAPHEMADIFVCKIGRVYSHAGIIGTYPEAIHASVADQIVTLCNLDTEAWPDAPRRFFRLKAWCDGR